MSRSDSLLENAVLKVYDDSLSENASNASGAGLEVRVTRTYDGKGLSGGRECHWCLDRCGENMTLDEAYNKGAFQRHPGCGCIIEYTSRRGEKTYQTGKSGPNNWLSEEEFQKRVNYGLDGRTPTPQERIINAAIEMQARDSRSTTLVNAIEENHEALKHYTPEGMKRRLERAGYKVLPLSQSQSGFSGVPLEKGGGFKILFGGDGIFRYHPKGGRHRVEYWTVSNSLQGVHKYGMDGKQLFFSK